MKQALRQLRLKPGFSVVVVLTLALTIGAATAVFSLFDAVLLRPFPYPEPDRLFRLRTDRPQVKNSTRDASVYDFWDYRDRNRSFTDLAAYVSFANNLIGQGPAQSVRMTGPQSALRSIWTLITLGCAMDLEEQYPGS